MALAILPLQTTKQLQLMNSSTQARLRCLMLAVFFRCIWVLSGSQFFKDIIRNDEAAFAGTDLDMQFIGAVKV